MKKQKELFLPKPINPKSLGVEAVGTISKAHTSAKELAFYMLMVSVATLIR